MRIHFGRIPAITQETSTMAEITRRLGINAPGPYYVDDTCIYCDLCRTIAESVFAQDEASGSSYVAAQPVTPEQFRLAQEALDECPVGAIGDDYSG
jgi:ferredoxin